MGIYSIHAVIEIIRLMLTATMKKFMPSSSFQVLGEKLVAKLALHFYKHNKAYACLWTRMSL